MIIDMGFAGRMASEFGIIVRSHRALRAGRTQNLIKLPGVDGAYQQGGESYDMKTIQVDCTVNQDDLPALRARAREIAAWLSKSGRLWFTDEPDKYDMGRIYSQLSLEQLLTHGTWTMEFLTQPFAYGKAVALTGSGSAPVTVSAEYSGTAPARCRILIRNVGPTPVTALRITQYRETGGYS